MALHPAKRRKISHPCFLCQKNGAKDCDGVRPCNVCLRNGYPQMCYLATTTTTNPTRVADTRPATLTNTPHGTSTSGNSSSLVNGDQETVNQYLLQEINRVKNTYKTMAQQMRELQLENFALKNKIEDLTTRTNELALQTSKKPDTDLPIVVYDLTHKPPIVKTANPLFCRMLGYTMSEVTGKPWQNFIHPDFVTRTVEALERASFHQKIELIQCYKHKGSGYFLTNDSYQIFTDINEKPIYVVVTICPEQEQTPVNRYSRDRDTVQNTVRTEVGSPSFIQYLEAPKQSPFRDSKSPKFTIDSTDSLSTPSSDFSSTMANLNVQSDPQSGGWDENPWATLDGIPDLPDYSFDELFNNSDTKEEKKNNIL